MGTHNTSRFRTNPVEILIFFIVISIFGNSLYQLIYVHNGFHPAALSPMSSNPISETHRNLASSTETKANSVSSSLMTFDATCDERVQKDTTAERVRLLGTVCGDQTPSSSTTLQKITVSNSSNHAVATVFTDSNSIKYSTDYIPLETGNNPIQIEISYSNGTVAKQVVEILRK